MGAVGYLRALCAAVVLFGSIGCSADDEGGQGSKHGSIELTNGKLVLMPLGDSITVGVSGGYRNDLYTSLTGTGLAVDMVGTQYDIGTEVADKDHEGHSGYPIAGANDALDGWLTAIIAPDVVLVMLGTNDFALRADASPGVTRDRMVEFVDRLRAKLPNATLIIATIPPMVPGIVEPIHLDRAEMTEQYNELLKSTLQARADHGTKVFVADVNAALTLEDLYDGFHPSREAHIKIANVFYDVMDDLLPAAP